MASNKSVTTKSWSLIRCCRPRYHNRQFSHSTRCLVNPLLNLSHFSAAKEAQFLSKERKIPREEFHPYIQLIRSSEVDPFAPVPGASPTAIAALEEAKAGKVDAETTYTLALSNMMSQVELSRRETMRVTSALIMLQEKHKREERNAFLFMLAAVGLLSFVMLKTSALEDLKEYALGAGNKANDLDRKGFSRPPSHKFDFRQSRLAQPEAVNNRTPPPQTRLEKVNQADVKPHQSAPTGTLLPQQSSVPPQDSEWNFSRLFWASRASKWDNS